MIASPLAQEKKPYSVLALKEMDLLLAQLANSVRVSVMPGSSDPSNYIIPQQPLHKCLLPHSFKHNTFQCVSNPYFFKIGGLTFLGTSGQNIDNLERYLVINNKLSVMEKTLEWSHLAPTAPDQLPCYPFDNTDPFIITQLPHVYFVGNQKEFKTKFIQGENGEKVRLIMVPSFAETQTVVLFNLKTLEASPIIFDTTLENCLSDSTCILTETFQKEKCT